MNLEKLVYDANLLDNIGRHGIKKALYVGSKIGRKESETYKYLKNNLKKVKFYTKIGKKLGKKEAKTMKVLLKHYEK